MALRLLAHAARSGVAAELEWMKAELDVRAELAILLAKGGLGASGQPTTPGPDSTTALPSITAGRRAKLLAS